MPKYIELLANIDAIAQPILDIVFAYLERKPNR